MSEAQKNFNIAQASVYILVAVTIGLTWFGLQDPWLGIIMGWFPAIFTSFILTGISSGFVESVTGNKLKKILLPLELGGFKFSISLFVVVAFLVKLWLFK